MNIKRTFLAVAIAPWASVFFILFIFAEHFVSRDAQLPLDFDLGSMLVLCMFVLGTVGTSYLFVIFVGLPIHLLLSKLNIRHWSAYVLSGLLVCLSWQHYLFSQNSMPPQLQKAGYMAYGISSILVSLVFWRVALSEHNKLSRKTAETSNTV